MLLPGRYRRPCDGAAHGSAVYSMEFVTADGFLKDLRPDPEDRISGVDLIWIFSEMKRNGLNSVPPFPNAPIYRSSQKHRERREGLHAGAAGSGIFGSPGPPFSLA